MQGFNKHSENHSAKCIISTSLRRLGQAEIGMESLQTTFMFLITLLVFLVAACTAITDPNDTAALLAVKSAITDNNNNLKNWGSGDPCDDLWEGVYCSDPDEFGTRNVIKLHLLKLNLSGLLAPEIGSISRLEILDFMWNGISGSIPKEIGKLSELQLLLLNGNNLTGALPEELGNLSNLDRLQIDENRIAGQLPISLCKLNKARHFHMNNNLLSGAIPWQFGSLQSLIHLLLDNNNLSGKLPPELGKISTLRILQLDNNQINGKVPEEYTKLKQLVKLSLRNCSLRGPVPDLSAFPALEYLDLSFNQLEGVIPAGPFSPNITTIDLAYNNLGGSIPTSFNNLSNLQALLLRNNRINGSLPSGLGRNLASKASTSYIVLDFQSNSLLDIDIKQISGLPRNISIWLNNNPVCNKQEFSQFCMIQHSRLPTESPRLEETTGDCNPFSCVPGQDELIPELAVTGNCFCAAPVSVGLRLKSPGFTFFPRYENQFRNYLYEGLDLHPYQVYIASYRWESGPRLSMEVKLFPLAQEPRQFDCPKLQAMFMTLVEWKLKDSEIFGPKDVRPFNATISRTGAAGECILEKPSKQNIGGGALAGIIVASIVLTAATLTLFVIWFVRKGGLQSQRFSLSRKGLLKGTSTKKLFNISEAESFSFKEISKATKMFSEEMKIGQGGHAKVYRGVLENGKIVAVKRAFGAYLKGEDEFYAEISLLSRVHHRNLVSLIGYCDESDERILVYEFMENGSLYDHLHKKETGRIQYLDFRTRLSIALGSARGILYLHTGVDPPIIHHDIKSSNILLDKRKFAKISDFGLSKQPQGFNINANPTHSISTKVRGTPGYLDPEYFFTGAMTIKSDVYSFGVVMLELLTGREPTTGGKSLVKEMKKAWENDLASSWIDVKMGWFPTDGVDTLIQLALDCVHPDPSSRPSMGEVVKSLYDISARYSISDTSSSHDQIPYNKCMLNESKEKSILEMNPISSSSFPFSTGAAQELGEEHDVGNNDSVSIIDSVIAR